MIEFQHPWLLVGIPLLLAVFFLTRRWRRHRTAARPKIRRLFADDGDRPPRVGSGLIGTVGLCFLLVALARPQWGEVETKTFENARQVIIGLDLSRSMLGTDVTPSRLERARLLMGTLLRELQGERVGLVVFAGTAFVQMPLTSDYEIMRELLKELNPNFLPEQGTNFNALLSTAYQAFDHRSTADKFLIVLSDGEDVVGNWRPEMEKLRQAGVRVITLGLATPEGSLLPDGQGGFIKDQNGAVVLSRLDETVLRELAETTGGLYQPAVSWVDLRDLIDRTIALGQTGTFEENRRLTKIDRFQIPLAAALLFLLISLWTDFPAQPSRRALRQPLTPRPRPARAPASAAVPATLLLLAPLSLDAQPTDPPPLPDLPGLVAQLAARPKLAPADYARLAEESITFGEATLGAGQKLSPGIVHDGLTAVDLGEARDPGAADWPELRRRLQELLRQAEEQPPQSGDSPQNQPPSDSQQAQNEQKQDDQNANQGQDGQSQSTPSSGQDERADSQSQTTPGSPDASGQPSDPDRNQSPEPPDQQPPSNPSRADGQTPRDEAKEQDSSSSPQPPPPQPESGQAQTAPKPSDPADLQEIGGGSTSANPASRDDVPPELQALLGRLDQLRENDAPGRIHQLFAPEQAPAPTQGKTW